MFGMGFAGVSYVANRDENRDIENGTELNHSGAIKLCTEYASNIYFPVCVGACVLIGVGFVVLSECYDH